MRDVPQAEKDQNRADAQARALKAVTEIPACNALITGKNPPLARPRDGEPVAPGQRDNAIETLKRIGVFDSFDFEGQPLGAFDFPEFARPFEGSVKAGRRGNLKVFPIFHQDFTYALVSGSYQLRFATPPSRELLRAAVILHETGHLLDGTNHRRGDTSIPFDRAILTTCLKLVPLPGTTLPPRPPDQQ
jgi:hypothetical protein